MQREVLQLDVQGTPQGWMSPERTVAHIATGTVVWADGASPLVVFRGGINAASGRRSVIEVPPIVALRGMSRINLFDVVPALSRAKLFRRDRLTCAYCGERFAARDLQCEHIVPLSRGGRSTWMNLVAACGPCNRRKDNRTPEEAGMSLVYLPYVPSLFENVLLEGRNVRADVHAWLARRLPSGSRLA